MFIYFSSDPRYVEQVTTGFSHYVILYKKRILDEWWEILTKLTLPDKPIDVIKRTPNSLHFTYQVCILYHTTIHQYRQDCFRVVS